MYSIISTCIKERDKDSSKEEGDGFVKKVGHLGGLLSDSFCICFSVLIFFFFYIQNPCCLHLSIINVNQMAEKMCFYIYLYIYTYNLLNIQ